MPVTRQQVDQFLELVRGLTFPADDQISLEAAIRVNAEAARQAVLTSFGVTLPTDPSGVQALDDLLNAMHSAVKPKLAARLVGGAISARDASLVTASLGAHLCELVRLRMSGEWGFAEYEGERYPVLILSPGNFMAVPQKAGKQFANGKSDSVQFFFGLAAGLAQARARVANMSPEERQALKDRVAIHKEKMQARKLMSKEPKPD
jgi:hypothetical protein